MNHTDPIGAEKAARATLANVSPRYLRLERLAKWVEGTQYKGRKSWWDDSVPLWEREPCIVYPVVSIAIKSNADLCLGEGKFPTFTVGGPTNDSPIEVALRSFHEKCRFRTVVKEAYCDGQGTKTAVSIIGARNGRPIQDTVPAKWCEREVDADGNVTKLTIQYPYNEEYKNERGEWTVQAKLYRRVIDQKRDVTYLPADADENGIAPNWVEDKTKTIEHNLGFCPVIWYPFMRGCQPVNEIDGKAIHELVTDEIQAHDIARSQWHRGALLSEPQICEFGVAPGYNPTGDKGRTPIVPSTEAGGEPSPLNPITGGYKDGQPAGARKKGPGNVWQYADPKTRAELLVYPSDALKAQQDNCSDLRIKIQESLAVVFLDPENIKFAATTSGKALEAIKQRQIDRVSDHRDDLRDGFIVPSIVMQLRVMKALGLSLKVRGVKEAMAELQALDLDDLDVGVKWGDYFKADPEEQKKLLDLAATALKGTPLVTRRKAVEKVASIFGIEDVGALMTELEKEDQARAEAVQSELKALQGGNAGPVPGDTRQVQ